MIFNILFLLLAMFAFIKVSLYLTILHHWHQFGLFFLPSAHLLIKPSAYCTGPLEVFVVIKLLTNFYGSTLQCFTLSFLI